MEAVRIRGRLLGFLAGIGVAVGAALLIIAGWGLLRTGNWESVEGGMILSVLFSFPVSLLVMESAEGLLPWWLFILILPVLNLVTIGVAGLMLFQLVSWMPYFRDD